MKRVVFSFFALMLILVSAGCENTKTRAVEGALIGGVLGAGAGYGIGQASHHGGEGAGIGAAAGALTGALIGSQINKPGQTDAAQANSNQMTMQQIVDLTRQKADDNVIIDRVRLSNSRFTLSPQDITYLKEQGVSSRVIDAMQGYY